MQYSSHHLSYRCTAFGCLISCVQPTPSHYLRGTIQRCVRGSKLIWTCPLIRACRPTVTSLLCHYLHLSLIDHLDPVVFGDPRTSSVGVDTASRIQTTSMRPLSIAVFAASTTNRGCCVHSIILKVISRRSSFRVRVVGCLKYIYSCHNLTSWVMVAVVMNVRRIIVLSHAWRYSWVSLILGGTLNSGWCQRQRRLLSSMWSLPSVWASLLLCLGISLGYPLSLIKIIFL